MNTGYPAVSSEGAAGVIEPVSQPYTLPTNWPAERVPTEDEWHRRMREARWPRAEVYR